jgi:hypothetical protein
MAIWRSGPWRIFLKHFLTLRFRRHLEPSTPILFSIYVLRFSVQGIVTSAECSPALAYLYALSRSYLLSGWGPTHHPDPNELLLSLTSFGPYNLYLSLPLNSWVSVLFGYFFANFKFASSAHQGTYLQFYVHSSRFSKVGRHKTVLLLYACLERWKNHETWYSVRYIF